MEHNALDLLKYADEEKFAIPAFNYSDVWEMEGIVKAAELENAPIFMMTNAQVSKEHTIEYLGRQALRVIEAASVPVVNHLDHCHEIDLCKTAVDYGYGSVMIDKSHLSLEENIEGVKAVVQYAHKFGIAVEGEMGRIKGKSIEGTYDGDDFLVDVESAVKLVNESGVDSIAIGIGNAHGFYKKKPELNFERLNEVNEATSIPLVLHGGTGIPEEDLQKAIRLGINKINIGTQLHYTYLQALKEELRKNPDCINIVDIMMPVRDAVCEVVRKCIRMCMADNKA